MVKALKLSLVRYIAQLNLSNEISISFGKPQEVNQKAIYLNGPFFADKTTEDSNVNFRINSSYYENNYIYDYGVEKKEILNLSGTQSFNLYIIQ